MIKGKEAATTKEKDHPFVMANASPAMHIATARMMEDIFSPRAFYIARHSFPILAESSLGLVRSNQAHSCFKMALK